MRRYRLCAGQERLPLLGGHHGLGDAQGAELAAIEYDACRLLRRSAERGHRKEWTTRDHEHGSRIAVHRSCLDHYADRRRVRISMDRRGRYLDNIFIERLWRSLRQEAIYLEEIADGFKARRVIKDWMAFYNTKRPHSALDRLMPDEAYWVGLKEQKAA